ncbi:MAG: Mobile element protein [Gemmataceae bacterium]|nr:Mobile element protein [Gemmataceae bacterium]
MPLSITDAFADLPDPRMARNQRHQLVDILTIALCAVPCGANTWEQIALHGRAKQTWFKRFLSLPNGIPSHDTFYRVFSALRPAAFARAFGRWMAAACEATGLTPIAIDGKSARRAKRPTATGCLHHVRAWATQNHLTLGQVAVPDGSNEIAVIPELLRALDLSGAIVTIDAAGTQVENARLIRAGGGHYVRPAKGNQPTLAAAVQAVFARACAADFAGVRYDQHAAVEDGHGRHEERYVTVIYEPEGIPADGPDVAAVVLIGRERGVEGKTESTAHYDITSHAGTAAELGRLIRGHWGIENTQSDDPRSDNLCVANRAGYHFPGGPSRARRMVPSARGPRRPFMRLDTPARVPPRARSRQPH